MMILKIIGLIYPAKNFQSEKRKLDFVIIQKFNKKFSKINYKNFISKILFEKLKCHSIYVSKNFKFGNKREGSVKNLKI